MDVVIPFWRRAPAIVQPKPAPEYFIIEARDSHPGCPNKHMRAYWVELWDGYPESETTIVWQGDAYQDARRACAEMLTGYAEEGANCCVIDHVAHRGGRCAEWWNLLCFTESGQAEIIRLEVGEKLSCQGALKLELYRASDGEQKISRTIIADGVLALRQPPRERKSRADNSTQAIDAALNDSIPF